MICEEVKNKCIFVVKYYEMLKKVTRIAIVFFCVIAKTVQRTDMVGIIRLVISTTSVVFWYSPFL